MRPFATLLYLALFANFVWMAGHDQQRLVEIGALLAVGVAVPVLRPSTVAGLWTNRANRSLVVFFMLGVLGGVVAFAPRLAFCEISILFLLYVWSLALAEDIADQGQTTLRFVLQALGVVSALYASLFAVAYFGSLSLGMPLDSGDFTAGFSNIRFFNHVQTSTLPLLILLCCLTPRTAKLRWLWLAVATYWWMALFATMGRGTLVGMAAGCVAVAVLARGRAWPYLRAVILTGTFGVLAYFLFLTVVPALLGVAGMNSFTFAIERTAADPTSARTPLWHLAIALIKEHPWLGVGPMHFAHYTGQLHIAAHPHDWLLQIGAEWGIPALLCLLAALALGVRALLRAGARIERGDAANQTIFAALVVGAVAILVDGLVSGIFVMPQSQLAIALYLGCAIGWRRSVIPAVPAAAPSRTRRMAGMACIVMAMACVIAGAWPEALAKLRNEELTPAEQALNNGDQWPRLWKAGHF
jgi:putative inorganic carbon (hco3(-)) transporter